MPLNPRDSQWIVYPQPDGRFAGFWTKDDPSRVPELAAVNGQNTTPNQGDRISIRNYGFDVYPTTATLSAVTSPTRSMWTFHKRDGSQILVFAQGSSLYWFDEVSQAKVSLGDSYTSDDFGFAEFNVNTDAVSYLYFGNAVQDFSRWTGNHTNLSGALVGGEATINVVSTTDFPATGTLRIGTSAVTYTGVTATSFTGCAGTPAAASGLAISQAVQTYPANPKGNIYLASDNRLFIAGIAASPQAVYISKYTDATDFVGAVIIKASTAENPAVFNLVEGGGPVTAMIKNEQTCYFFKENIVYAATVTDNLYSVVPLKPFDGRSQTTGAKSKRSVFVGGNRVFFVSKDNQIYSLQRVETVDYPQMVAISQPIQPTVNDLDFGTMSGIVYGSMAYFSCKSSATASVNDTVLTYNILNNTWDTPVVNINAAEWAVYKVSGVERLLFGDSYASNVFIIQNTPLDYQYPTVASWKTKQYDFGQSATLKELDGVFIEGYISSNTNLTVSLLLDDNGFTETLSTTIAGTETQYTFFRSLLNLFGLRPFGTTRFGSNTDTTGRKKFRVYLNKDLTRVPFFTAQLEFSSSGQNQKWEIIRYGFQVRQHSQPIKTALMRNW